jgi:hypothetical protein
MLSFVYCTFHFLLPRRRLDVALLLRGLSSLQVKRRGIDQALWICLNITYADARVGSGETTFAVKILLLEG